MDRLFAGVFSTGISYADRECEEHGDYKRLAFLDFARLQLVIEKDCPEDLADRIQEDAGKIIQRRGERYQISTSGQSVILGSTLKRDEVTN